MIYKTLTVVCCAIGVTLIAYGMLRDNDLIFLAGLPFVAGGYLMIRKKLKESLQPEQGSNP
jgi:hypothetical protein